MQTKLPSLAFVTLGCAKNEVDTNRMRAQVLHASYPVVDETADADIVIVNSCSFLQVSTEEGITTTLEILDQSHELKRDVQIVLTGCIPSRYKLEELAEALPEVAAFVPSDDEDNIVSYLEDISGIKSKLNEAGEQKFLRTVEAPFAYVKISEGCDRMCTFCAIPYIRGRYRSRNSLELFEEIQALLEGGVKELVLIGQDTGVWGQDFKEGDPDFGKDLSDLMRELACLAQPYRAWIRVLYLQPEGLNDKLIQVMKDYEEVLPYFDIPIQHCSGTILKRMNRSGDASYLSDKLRYLRKELPGCILRTTVISGFPGESDEEAEDLCEFLRREAFDYAGVFMYSQEDGTVAARFDGQIPEELKLQRAQAVQDVIDEVGFAACAQHIGEVCEVLVDGVEELADGQFEYLGRAWFQAPDTDGVVHLPGITCCLGERIKVRFVDSYCYELVGVLADD